PAPNYPRGRTTLHRRRRRPRPRGDPWRPAFERISALPESPSPRTGPCRPHGAPPGRPDPRATTGLRARRVARADGRPPGARGARVAPARAAAGTTAPRTHGRASTAARAAWQTTRAGSRRDRKSVV